MQKAKGKWHAETRATPYDETEKIYTFHADSGFTAVMTKPGHRHNPYHCVIKNPQGNLAVYVNDDGRRITGMEIHLNLPDAKTTVQERLLELEKIASAAL